MNIFEKIENLKPVLIFKTIGLSILTLAFVAIALQILGAGFSTVFNKSYSSNDMMESSFSQKSLGLQIPGISIRNTSPAYNAYADGDDAEAYEVTEYNASIKTRHLDNTCNQVLKLKEKDYVIFQNSQKQNTYCNYSFKVKNDNIEEVLATINSLKPESLSENKYTIKQVVSDYTSKILVLKNKVKSIDDTLNNAITAYDQITRLATETRDAESLAKIITSKIDIIERLTQERLKINEQLDIIERSKSGELDRLEYSYFNVNIVENKFIDTVTIKNSWRRSVKNFVTDTNETLQNVTINLATLFFRGIQVALYFVIMLLVVKYGWKFTKRIWRN